VRGQAMIAHALILGVGSALAPLASAADTPCFGGMPEVMVRNQPQAMDLRVQGRTLLWSSGGSVRSLDLDTGAVKTLGSGDLRAADDQHVVTITGRNQLLMLDRRTRKQRVLVDGHRAFEIALVSSAVAIHGGYVYFGFTAPRFRVDEAGFFRVRLDGRGRPERLAAEPDGETPFVVAGDAVVWMDGDPGAFLVHKRPLGTRGAGRVERRPWAADRGVRGTPFVEAIRLVGDQLYFVADKALWSLSLDRQEPPRERVKALPPSPQGPPDFAVHGACAYFVTDDAIRRARLDSGAALETLIRADRLGAPSLATDGRYLYWPSRDGDIMRAGASATAHVVRPPVTARPAAVQANSPLDKYQFLVGDDMGCAMVVRSWDKGGHPWRCWRAGPATLPPLTGPGASGLSRVESFAMPGLDELYLFAGSGRVCARGAGAPPCALESKVLDSRGQVLRSPNPPPSAQVYVGDKFACTLAEGWRCTGDDTFGQLAANLTEPARSVADAWRAGWAIGAWHGCVNGGGKVVCWGRNDVGQLGHASPDLCPLGGAVVPCSRSPRETAAPKNTGLIATDQYTCSVGKGGPWCWGGSRDGLFGTAAACGPALREAWPTRAGPVAAPQATCAREPVHVRGFSDADAGRPSPAARRARERGKHPRGEPLFASFSAGPRGICAIAYGRVRCRGAVPTPVNPAGGPELFHQVLVHTGERPGACANNRREVICWGAGYSPESQPGRPVEIDFGEGASGGAPVIDSPPSRAGDWPKECLVHRACSQLPPALPTCDARAGVAAWTDLLARASGLLGTRIVVRGRLAVGRSHREPCSWNATCCPNTSRAVVVGATDLDADGLLKLENLECRGDDSRLCCNVPAYGQQVRVEGTLERAGVSDFWLKAPQVCQEPVQ